MGGIFNVGRDIGISGLIILSMYAEMCSVGPEQPLTMGLIPWPGGFMKQIHTLGPSALWGD